MEHRLRLVSNGFKLLSVAALIFGIGKAVLIGLLFISPGVLISFMTIYEMDHVYLDLGLFRQINGISMPLPPIEKLLLILISVGSGVLIAFVFYSVSILLDFFYEVGTEILDWRRIQFERGHPK